MSIDGTSQQEQYQLQEETDQQHIEEQQPLELSQNEFAGAAPASPQSSPSLHPDQRDRKREALALTPREVALQEAKRVLEASSNLENFNLLGVVANPRGDVRPQRHYYHNSSATAALHHYSTTQHGASGLEDTIQALESTLSQVTEQIDAINFVVDAWSRTYLGTLYDDDNATQYHAPYEDIASQLTELPEELASLTLVSVQNYLNETGVLAHAFEERNKKFRQDPTEWHERVAPDSDLQDLDANAEEFMEQLEDAIPNRFFETYFDLTDSKTFSEFLVLDTSAQPQGEAITDGTNALDQLPDALRIPTTDILKLPPPDSFTGFLDKVELALLQQVRSKSIAFFHETNRFGQLKEWITGLVEEVQRVRTLLANVQDTSVVAWELIPLLDKQRQDLIVLEHTLEGASNVLRCKSSIGGLLSANDDLGAAEQIQYGRELLRQVPLKHLLALKTVNDQLSQYEALVVANLGEELVEILLDWKSFVKTPGDSNTIRIKDMIRGLQLCSALEKVSKLYANRLLDVIRMTVRTTVGEFAEEADGTVKACVTSMTLERFADCVDMLFEQLLDILKSAFGVKTFGTEQGVDVSADTLTAAAELSSKSISELLRLRKEAHSLVSLDEMKRLWDVTMGFTTELENLSDYKATALRSTLLAQAKAFVERQHESNMSALVAALDSERWTQCDVSSERQWSLTRLCSGRVTTSRQLPANKASTKSPLAQVEGVGYKVVWSCLLLVEMMLNNIACAAYFQSLATNIVAKVAELLRLFNSRSTQLVLGAGAIHSAARLKSINAKHLSLVTQCLGMIIAILPHVRAALMAQLPSKNQHALLQDLDKIKKEYENHNEQVLNKFVTIIGGIVEHTFAPRIAGTNFDQRAYATDMCVFLEGVSTNTRKMHQVLSSLLPPDHLRDVFSRIFAYIDKQTPDLFVAASTPNPNNRGAFYFPTTDGGKRQMLIEVETMTTTLNNLAGVRPWEFTAIRVLERQLDFVLHPAVAEMTRNGEANGEENGEGNGDINGGLNGGKAEAEEKRDKDDEVGEVAASGQLNDSSGPDESNDTTGPNESPNAKESNNHSIAETNGHGHEHVPATNGSESLS